MNIKAILSKICKYFILFITLPLITTIIFLSITQQKQIKELVYTLNYAPQFTYKSIFVKTNNDYIYNLPILKELQKIKYNNTPKIVIVRETQEENITPQVKITITQEPTQYTFLTQTFIPVGHLYWIKDKFEPKVQKIYCLEQNCAILKSILPRYKFVPVKDITNLIEKLQNNETIPAIIPFNELNPSLKLLSYQGKYFLDTQDTGGSITVYFNLIPTSQENAKYAQYLLNLINTNKNIQREKPQAIDKTKIATLIQTGVTAISRALAYKMEALNDYTYPAKPIKDFLINADLTHTSNEVSFVPGCKPTNGMRFCSNPNYFKLLQYIDLDIVELTGNHNNDYGSTWNTWTIEKFYKKYNIDYFGGGINDKDASKILVKEIKGTKIAFLGYNYYDTIYHNTNALATPQHAGANSFSFEKLKNDINKAKKLADIVVVDFQFQECYAYPDSDVIYPICYKPLSYPDQNAVFRKAIDLGADIVVGTQAHQPQTYEIYKGKPIFYGLGNIFFDQIYWIGTRQALILKHYFYKGKLIQTRIITLLQDKNFQEHIVWDQNRTLLLKLLKEARK